MVRSAEHMCVYVCFTENIMYGVQLIAIKNTKQIENKNDSDMTSTYRGKILWKYIFWGPKQKKTYF